MLLICASEVQKHRRISKNLATRKTQMLVTAETTPPWTLTSSDHRLLLGRQRPQIPLVEGLPDAGGSCMEKENKRPPAPAVTASSSNGRGRPSKSLRFVSSAQNNRQNSADPDKAEQRKMTAGKNKKKHAKPKTEMISSRPASAGKIGDAFNRNEKNDDRKQKHGHGAAAVESNNEPAASGVTMAGKPGRKTAASSAATSIKKQRTAEANYQHPWLYTTLKGHTGQVFDMDFSRNGKYLATCGEDRVVFLWSTKEFASTKDRRSFRINVDYDHAVRVRWSPDGRALVVYKYNECCVEVYKVDKVDSWFQNSTKGATFPRAHMDDIVGFGISPDGKYLMSCSNKTELTVWDVRGNVLEKVDTFLMSTHAAKISPCGKFIAACGFASDVPVWEVKFTKSGEFQAVQRAFDLTGHKSGVWDVAFDQDTSKTVTVCKDGSWKVFNTKIEYQKGEIPRCLVSGTFEPTSAAALVALSPSGEVVAISTGKSIHFYSAITGKLDDSIENMCTGYIAAMQFDSTGKYLLVAADRYIRVFHNVTGYKVTLECAQEKLKQSKMSAAMRERIEMQIAESEAFLKKFE